MNTSTGECFPSLRGKFRLKTDSQATMGGLISAPLSDVLVPDTVSNAHKPWWLMIDEYVCI